MAKYVKLGQKSTIFHDPTTNIKILPNQVVSLSGKSKMSKKILNALRGGHLENATEEEYEKYQVSLEGQPVYDDEGSDDNWIDDFEDYSDENLLTLTKSKLIELAIFHQTDLSEKDLDKMTKKDIVEEIKELTVKI